MVTAVNLLQVKVGSTKQKFILNNLHNKTLTVEKAHLKKF